MANNDSVTDIKGVDTALSLYDLTDLFFSWYKYHNEECLHDMEYLDIDPLTQKVSKRAVSLSRFEVLRRIEAMKLNSRPHMGGLGITATKYNINHGYLSLILSYLRLPYKAMFSDNQFTKIHVDRNLYETLKLSKKELEGINLQKKNNPDLYSNAEVSDTATDCFNNLLRINKEIASCHDFFPSRIIQDGFVAAKHTTPGQDFRATPIHPLDLVFEPQALHDVSTWNAFFIIRKMPVREVKDRINKPGVHWNAEALRWALEESREGRNLVNYDKHAGLSLFGEISAPLATENFSVKSFYSDKSKRIHNIGGYYGNLVVIEGFYIDADSNIKHVIFFPSTNFFNIPDDLKEARKKNEKGEYDEVNKANTFFTRTYKLDDLSKFLTVVPFDRSELTLERQRAYGHELYNPVEGLMRIDSSIMNAVSIMGSILVRDTVLTDDATKRDETEINVTGEMVDIGQRQIVANPIVTDLNAMLAARSMLYQLVISKAFLGGLDGTEQSANGRGANLANLRLVRDGRIHKHNLEDFAKGLKPFYSNILYNLLKIIETTVDWDSSNLIIQRLFYDVIVNQMGFPKTLFDCKEEDILSDTGLPYWLSLEVVRNGASHFGPAEMILYSEIKQVFGDALSQDQMQRLNHMGIKSMLGPQDAIDIFGTPQENLVTEQDQIYRAFMENASILGSVDQGTVNFEKILNLPDKDDDIAHLSMVHNPKAQEIIDRLNQSEVSPEQLQEASTNELETRTILILKLGALANHISLHASNLNRYGTKRTDVNKLKEETNNILQSAEGLMNNLQNYLRTLEAKRQDEQLRLQNISPENEAEKLKQQTELTRLDAAREDSRGKLALANKIAEQKQTQHIDSQLSKAKDRELKARMAEREASLKLIDKNIQKEKIDKDFVAKIADTRVKAVQAAKSGKSDKA